jgi:hypothetical protein
MSTLTNLDRLGQIRNRPAKLTPCFLKLGMAEVLDAFDRNCVFKGKVKERNIRGGKSAAFQITGRTTAGVPHPRHADPWRHQHCWRFSDRNERIINLDGLLVASEVIYELDELMNYVDVSARTPRISWAKPWRVSGTCAAPVFSMAQPRTPPSR